MPKPLVIATWKFGRVAVEVAAPMLRRGEPALYAAIAGAQAVEDDPAVTSVGYGGLPDALGVLTLDACVMDGKTLDCGSVIAVENIRHVTALARLVMERTPHVCLAGAGAQQFAIEQGMTPEILVTADGLAEWLRRKTNPGRSQHTDESPASHDTVTVLALDQHGNLGGACSTSGLVHKRHGRVGDSPIVGSGLYVDNTAGAAGGTGTGEEIIRINGSFFIVEQMRAGKSPQEACEAAIRRINETAARRGVAPAEVAFLAINLNGEAGGAATVGTKFDYACSTGGEAELVRCVEIESH